MQQSQTLHLTFGADVDTVDKLKLEVWENVCSCFKNYVDDNFNSFTIELINSMLGDFYYLHDGEEGCPDRFNELEDAYIAEGRDL